MCEERWKTEQYSFRNPTECIIQMPQPMIPYSFAQFPQQFISLNNDYKINNSPINEINSYYPCNIILLPQEFKSKKSKTSFNEALNLINAIKEMNCNIGKSFEMNYMCERFGIKRRMFFDFLSISSAFGLIEKQTNDEFIWNGSTLPPDVIKSFRNVMLEDSLKIEDIFSCYNDSGIKKVAFNLLSLFTYLQTNLLDLRVVGKLFTQGKNNYKTMLKKLYTVASTLECLEILSKTGKTAEVKLNVIELIPNSQQNFADINTLLNTKENIIKTRIIKDHKEQFEVFMKKNNTYNYL